MHSAPSASASEVSHVGQAIFLNSLAEAPGALCIHNTRVFQFLRGIQIGLGEATVSGCAARHYSGGSVGKLRFPATILETHRDKLVELAARIVAARRMEVEDDESSWRYDGLCLDEISISNAASKRQ